MAKFKIYEAGIACLSTETVETFERLELAAPKTLSATDIGIFMAAGKTYLRLDDPARPFRPNPKGEPTTGMFIWAHPDAIDPKTGELTDPTRLIGLYYDVEGMNPDGTPIITPRKWLLGPKASAVIPYQWTCCGGWSAVLVAGDADFTPGKPHTASATIIDPPTVQPHHEQYFSRADGGQITFDTTGELLHALLHLMEQDDPALSHDCRGHAHIHTGHRPKGLVPKQG